MGEPGTTLVQAGFLYTFLHVVVLYVVCHPESPNSATLEQNFLQPKIRVVTTNTIMH